MRKRFDDLFSTIMFAAAIVVVLASWLVLSHSIACIEEEALRPCQTMGTLVIPHVEIVPSPEPTPEPDYSYIPLDESLTEMLVECCEEYNVPLYLALGLIEVESSFRTGADNGLCYGLCQLNRDYFPDNLPPADNLRVGIEYLGRLLEQYGDTGAALTSYNAGHDTGYRGYANAVLAAAKRWAEEAAQ